MRRDIFIAQPPSGDYILSPTGFTWGVRRTSAAGSVMSVLEGERSRKRAVATLLSLAKDDQADAWEPAGPGSYRLIKANRTNRTSASTR